MSMLLTPVSYGEVLDKITILEIKSSRITDQDKLKNIKTELNLLLTSWNNEVNKTPEIIQLKEKLKSINQSLWDIEDNIRIKESKNQFDDEFIQIARSVYYENDKRAATKKEVNLLLGSIIVEEKSYEKYD